MKKLFYILFVTIYLFLSVGITITAHFCGGKVHSVSLIRSSHDPDPCECNPETCCNPCCSDEVKTIKIEDSYTAQPKFEIPNTDTALSGYADYVKTTVSPEIVSYQLLRIPPNLQPKDICLLNSSFLI